MDCREQCHLWLQIRLGPIRAGRCPPLSPRSLIWHVEITPTLGELMHMGKLSIWAPWALQCVFVAIYRTEVWGKLGETGHFLDIVFKRSRAFFPHSYNFNGLWKWVYADHPRGFSPRGQGDWHLCCLQALLSFNLIPQMLVSEIWGINLSSPSSHFVWETRFVLQILEKERSVDHEGISCQNRGGC